MSSGRTVSGGLSFARCPGPCGRWRSRVWVTHAGRYAVRRHEPCGLVYLEPGAEVRPV